MKTQSNLNYQTNSKVYGEIQRIYHIQMIRKKNTTRGETYFYFKIHYIVIIQSSRQYSIGDIHICGKLNVSRLGGKKENPEISPG